VLPQRWRARADLDLSPGVPDEQLPEALVQGVPAGLHLLITFPGSSRRPGHLDDAELARR
jgi:hypothetical protein